MDNKYSRAEYNDIDTVLSEVFGQPEQIVYVEPQYDDVPEPEVEVGGGAVDATGGVWVKADGGWIAPGDCRGNGTGYPQPWRIAQKWF